jgi:hypothetical protein
MASGSRHAMRYTREVVRGTTPATPAMKTIRHTGTTLGKSRETLESQELRDDRNVTDVRGGTFNVAGNINFELSFGTFDELLEAALMGTWAIDAPVAGTDRLGNGVIRRYHTIERYFADIADKPYHRFVGCEIDTFDLQVNANAMVTGAFGILGKDLGLTAGVFAGATYPAASTTSPLDSFTGTLKEGGVDIAVVTEISLSLKNGLAPRYVVGQKASILPSVGRSNLTGNLTVLFEDSVMLEKFLDETETELEFSLPDAAGNNMRFWIPRLKYMGGQPDVDGEGDIPLSLPFQALYDSVEGSNIYIDRTAA